MTDDAFLDILRNRRSIRRFQSKPIARELLHRLVEAAAWAPSAGNRQNWEFTIVTSQSCKDRMADAVRAEWKRVLGNPEMAAIAESLRDYSKLFDWFGQAPALIALSSKTPESFMTRMFGPAAADVAGSRASAAMAAQNLMLAAHASGLGSCCLTAPLAAQESLKTILDLGDRQAIVCLIAVGYAAEKPVQPARKAIDSIVRFME